MGGEGRVRKKTGSQAANSSLITQNATLLDRVAVSLCAFSECVSHSRECEARQMFSPRDQSVASSSGGGRGEEGLRGEGLDLLLSP